MSKNSSVSNQFEDNFQSNSTSSNNSETNSFCKKNFKHKISNYTENEILDFVNNLNSQPVETSETSPKNRYQNSEFMSLSSKSTLVSSSNNSPYINSYLNEIQANPIGKNLNQILNVPSDAETIKECPGKKKHMDDAANRINVENILKGKDRRTTLMIRHIPNKYNLYSFLEDINVDFKGTYDVFYLPIDYKNNCNLGFAFINFVDPLHILDFYESFRGKRWRRFKSEKICELAYAKFQGKAELENHFLNGSVIKLDSEEKKPVILNTPTPLPPIQIPIVIFFLI